jgi:nicotinate (nicotinamide) nucleotide adenylyltransferase
MLGILKLTHTALFFGSFNPFHEAHKAVVDYLAAGKVKGIEEVWMIITPENPLVVKETLFSGKERIDVLNKIFEGQKNILVSDIEFELARPLYTYLTLRALADYHPDRRFYFVMGSDLVFQLEQWHEVGEIVHNYTLLVFKRPGYTDGLDKAIEKLYHTYKAKEIRVIDGPLMDLSSTEVRSLVKERSPLDGIVPEEVEKAIQLKQRGE